MSIIVQKEIMCDRCCEWVRVDSVNIEWPNLRKEGWFRGGGKHLCPKCSGRKKFVLNFMKAIKQTITKDKRH